MIQQLMTLTLMQPVWKFPQNNAEEFGASESAHQMTLDPMTTITCKTMAQLICAPLAVMLI